jgi:hypothetical protein
VANTLLILVNDYTNYITMVNNEFGPPKDGTSSIYSPNLPIPSFCSPAVGKPAAKAF